MLHLSIPLVYRRTQPWISASVDGIIRIKRCGSDDEPITAAIEIKTMCSSKTLNEAQIRLGSLGLRSFKTIVTSGLKFIYGVLITISLDYRSTYESFLHTLKQTHLSWVYGNEQIPDFNEENTSTKGYQVYKDCIDLHLGLSSSLWTTIIQKGKPLPPGKHLIPSIVAYWNRNKGGVDVLSRYLKNVKIPLGRVSPRVVYVIRMIFMLIFSGFQAYKLHNGLEEIQQASNYLVLKQSWARATSFKSSLGVIGHGFFLPGAAVTVIDDTPSATLDLGQVRTLVNSVHSYRKKRFRDDGRLAAIRLDTTLRHEHVLIGKHRETGKQIARKCQLCEDRHCTTSYWCSVCLTPLCIVKRNGKRRNCSQMWHRRDMN